jgi:tetratricopeptide (TPR) repeat protein
MVEDLHWADRGILDQLATLTKTVGRCPALLVMTSRLEGDPLDTVWRSSVMGAPVITLDLGPLRDAEVEVLASGYRHTLGEIVHRCIARAEGNPLFLDQLLRHAEESADKGLPASIQALVQARLDQLASSDKQALQAASVLGQRFALDTLCALLDQPGYDCGPLVRHFLLRQQEDHFLFAHALIQEGVYHSLLKGKRRELHRRAAGWFESRDPILYAEHLDRAEDTAAAAAYLTAARSQAAEYRAGKALQLVERGLSIARDRADEFALTVFHGETLRGLGSISDSIAAFERALAVAADDTERCRALVGLAAGMRVADRFDDAFAALSKAETMASSHRLVAELASIHHLRGNLCFPLGRLQECLGEHELALELAHGIEDSELAARALGGLGDAEYARGRMVSAHNRFSRCLELARTYGFGRTEVANLSMIAHTQIYLNDLSGALATSAAAIDLAARVGHPRAEIIAHNAAINVFYTNGDLRIAREHAERRGSLIRALGALRFESLDLETRATIAYAEGRPSEGLELMQRSVASCRLHARSFLGPWILGHFAVTTDDPSARRDALAEGEAILGEGAVSHSHLWFYRYAIEASLNDAAWSEAERYATALENYTRPEPLPWAELFIGLGRALAARGRDRDDHTTVSELHRLHYEARRLDLATALPMIDRGLADR